MSGGNIIAQLDISVREFDFLQGRFSQGASHVVVGCGKRGRERCAVFIKRLCGIELLALAIELHDTDAMYEYIFAFDGKLEFSDRARKMLSDKPSGSCGGGYFNSLLAAKELTRLAQCHDGAICESARVVAALAGVRLDIEVSDHCLDDDGAVSVELSGGACSAALLMILLAAREHSRTRTLSLQLAELFCGPCLRAVYQPLLGCDRGYTEYLDRIFQSVGVRIALDDKSKDPQFYIFPYAFDLGLWGIKDMIRLINERFGDS